MHQFRNNTPDQSFLGDFPQAVDDAAQGEWRANITTIQRRQCIVFTHDQTRFSLALIGVTQKELKELTFWFSDMLGNTMLKLGYPVELMERAVNSFSELSFDTQCSRSVQGTLKNMILDLEAFTWDGSHIMDLGPYSLSANLCKRPCSIKGMKHECIFPDKEMRKLLEHLPDPNETVH
ncbi:hypothetical protein ADIMK_3988 [Marinobacterium lacunae]|uniref:DUF6933 domain-containing protein n=1 Tax=Marinobacterium lacunae TaxID=1232683 RepID=A0A081FTI6_9GAMM|nr:hypothetical protein [Marinobacterium lacunae]KEA61841.1 hypothetical protein ADIMK_3988 [Marinobacterium lacunae]